MGKKVTCNEMAIPYKRGIVATLQSECNEVGSCGTYSDPFIVVIVDHCNFGHKLIILVNVIFFLSTLFLSPQYHMFKTNNIKTINLILRISSLILDLTTRLSYLLFFTFH